MSTKKPNYQIRTETSRTTSKHQDGLRTAKPAGARFKGEGNYKSPTLKEIAADHNKPASKQKIYSEHREKRSDKKPSVRNLSFGQGGFIDMISSIGKKRK